MKMHIRKLFFFIFSSSILFSQPALSSDTEICPLHRKHIRSEDDALALAERVVVVYKLLEPSGLSLDCVEFNPSRNRKEPIYTVDVREHHSQECGGDPMFAPRILSLNISSDGRLTTDAYDHVYFKPLVCPKKKTQ